MSGKRTFQAALAALAAVLTAATVAAAGESGRTIRLVTGDKIIVADLGWKCSLNRTAFGKALVCTPAVPAGSAAPDPTVVMRGSEAVVALGYTTSRPTVERGALTTYKFGKYFP